jgi:hypothetical protein
MDYVRFKSSGVEGPYIDAPSYSYYAYVFTYTIVSESFNNRLGIGIQRNALKKFYWAFSLGIGITQSKKNTDIEVVDNPALSHHETVGGFGKVRGFTGFFRGGIGYNFKKSEKNNIVRE